MQQWYRRVGECRIELLAAPDRYWPPDVVHRVPLQIGDIKGREVQITGPGAMWMYAHAAAIAAANHKDIEIILAGPDGDSDDVSATRLTLSSTSCHALLQISLDESARLRQSVIEASISNFFAHWPNSNFLDLCITGRANGVAYARVAEEAVRRGVARVYCWTPADGLVLIFDREGLVETESDGIPEWLESFLDPPKSPVIIGVLGDPNCGKSVLSLALNHYRWRRGIRGWRLDCDGASPTPDWYLTSMATDPEEARRKRNAIKCSWTPVMEDRIAARLRRLRAFFDVAIADLPGGDHSKSPPERVPKHREVILREIDAFILLEREDQPTLAFWEDALRSHGLSQKVVAMLQSTDPKAEPCMAVQQDDHGVWRGRVSGLDRQNRPEQLFDGLRGGFDAIWPSLQRPPRRATETP